MGGGGGGWDVAGGAGGVVGGAVGGGGAGVAGGASGRAVGEDAAPRTITAVTNSTRGSGRRCRTRGRSATVPALSALQ